MDIRIDESGPFIPMGPGRHKVSAIGALVLPSQELDEIYTRYAELRWDLPKTEGEVKGSGLGESQIATVIEFLLQYEVLFDAVICDVGAHRRREIVGFQSQQVDELRSSVGEDHHPEMVEEVHHLADRLSGLSLQLFVQHQMIIELVDRVLRHAPLYFVQRSPAELGSFTWIVDAKDHELTTYEEVWSHVVFPAQQARSAKDPHISLQGADYSHFERFLIGSPDLQGPPYSPEDEADLRVIDLTAVLMDGLSFLDSRRDYGLELVDILTNALTRAMNGGLKRAGWGKLGRLMVRVPRKTVRMIAFRAQAGARDRIIRVTDHYGGVVQALEASAKNMVVENLAS